MIRGRFEMDWGNVLSAPKTRSCLRNLTLILVKVGARCIHYKKSRFNTIPSKRGRHGHGRNKEAGKPQGGGWAFAVAPVNYPGFSLQAKGSGQKFRLNRNPMCAPRSRLFSCQSLARRGALFDKFHLHPGSWMEGLGDAL